ncbi:hypothetical protein, partial [Bacillus pumilus]|uniref:hypothetical protein n=1 Tax=Bacillus pumilus TaxID=1408 RepID=UPI0016432FE4
LEGVCRHYGMDMEIRVKDMGWDLLDKILYGRGCEGIYLKYENDECEWYYNDYFGWGELVL